MAASLKMTAWTKNIEENLTIILKDWMKAHGKTQIDLSASLNTASSRMPALLAALKNEFRLGGLARVAYILCEIETAWADTQTNEVPEVKNSDPFDQLDLLMEELKGNSGN